MFPASSVVRRRALLVATLALALPVALAARQPVGVQAQQPASDFTWDGRVAPGAILQVRNINGSILVERSSGDRVEVVATKRWRRGNPAIARIEATRYGPNGANALICAIWGSSTCDEAGYHGRNRINGDDGDVRVEISVKLPAGVRTRLESVNGDISIIGASAGVTVETVNGAIEVQTARGPVQATSVNGNIDVRIDALPAAEGMSYETVNGSITLHLPSEFEGELEMETVNGTLHTDFPITVQGRFNPRHIRSRVGSGGPLVTLETVNGSIELRKRR